MKSDKECLIAACRHGDERACKRLYDEYAAPMLGVCLRYAGNRAVAQDMLSEGFIKVFTNLDKLRDVNTLGAWIRRVMVNTALNYLRDNKEFPSVDDLNELELPCDIAYDRYDTEQLLKAIQQLPDNYRAVFNLYEVEGYSHDEIAKRLGLQNSNVRLILSRAKRTLQKTLGEKRDYL
jgi:RNA polymerase sigma-70 factor (ECF subfamily)